MQYRFKSSALIALCIRNPMSLTYLLSIIINMIISFMQSIYPHIPEANYVPREYGVAAILLFLFMVLISLISVLNLLYFHISTFRSMCAVPNMAVFCNSLTSWFPGMLLTYFLNVFEIVPVVSFHRHFLPGTSLERVAIPNARASSFTLQYFLYYV